MIVPIAQSANGTLTDWLDTSTSLRWTVTGGTPTSRAFNAQETAVATAAVTAGNATADTATALTNLAVNKTVSTQRPSTTGYWLMRPGPSTSNISNGNLVGAVIEGHSGRADEQYPAEILAFGDGDLTTDSLSLQIWGPLKASANAARPNIQMFAKKPGGVSSVQIAADSVNLNGTVQVVLRSPTGNMFLGDNGGSVNLGVSGDATSILYVNSDNARLGPSASPALSWSPTSVSVRRSTWTAPTYTNSWANAPGYTAGGYTLDALGFVCLRGVVQNTGQATTSMFTLPTGYRPSATRVFLATCSGGTCRFHVNVDGTVSPQFYSSGSDSSFFSIEGCRFDPT